jgi:hypothetical protein
MADEPLMLAAMNFTTAMAKLPRMAATTATLEPP